MSIVLFISHIYYLRIFHGFGESSVCCTPSETLPGSLTSSTISATCPSSSQADLRSPLNKFLLQRQPVVISPWLDSYRPISSVEASACRDPILVASAILGSVSGIFRGVGLWRGINNYGGQFSPALEDHEHRVFADPQQLFGPNFSNIFCLLPRTAISANRYLCLCLELNG